MLIREEAMAMEASKIIEFRAKLYKQVKKIKRRENSNSKKRKCTRKKRGDHVVWSCW